MPAVAARPRTPAPQRAFAAALAAIALVLLAGTLAVAPATASTLIVEGAGEGHGVGMSQNGALGFARHGYTYEQILAHYYSATTIGTAPPGAVVRVLIGSKVKRVPLERYVRGVISAEASPSWPAAALQAQAVASRTYALTAHAGGSRFDVYSDTRSQLYRGSAGETPTTNAAVAATTGQIVLYGASPAITYFFASSGGSTENVEDGFPGAAPAPWLRAVPDPYEGSASKWTINLSFSAAAHRLKGLFKGTFKGIEVLQRGASPRILSARVLGTAGATVVTGQQLAARLGLSSTWAYFSVRSGATVKAEPDHSGQPHPAAPATPASNVPAPSSSGGVSPTESSPGEGSSDTASGGAPAGGGSGSGASSVAAGESHGSPNVGVTSGATGGTPAGT